MASFDSEISRAMRDLDRKNKKINLNKAATLIIFFIFIVFTVLYLFPEWNITGFAVQSLGKANSCYLDHGVSSDKVSCRYFSHDDSHINIDLAYNDINAGSGIKITKIIVNDCIDNRTAIIGAGKIINYSINCPGSAYSNKLKILYSSLKSGMEHSAVGEIRIMN